MATPQELHDAAYQRLAQAYQRKADYEFQQQEMMKAQIAAQEKARQRELERNQPSRFVKYLTAGMQGGGQGASVGGSFGGGWGALIGGIAGTARGIGTQAVIDKYGNPADAALVQQASGNAAMGLAQAGAQMSQARVGEADKKYMRETTEKQRIADQAWRDQILNMYQGNPVAGMPAKIPAPIKPDVSQSELLGAAGLDQGSYDVTQANPDEYDVAGVLNPGGVPGPANGYGLYTGYGKRSK